MNYLLSNIICQSLMALNVFMLIYSLIHFSSVQLLSRVRLFATWWTTARQASLSITNSRSLPKLMSIESVIPSSYLILCWPFFLLPSIFPSIRVFSNESALRLRWPKYWSFSIQGMNIQGWFPWGLSGLISCLFKGLLESLLQHRSWKASILQHSAFFIV